MWAVMAWLQILAKKTEAAGKLVSVEDKKTKKTEETKSFIKFIRKLINVCSYSLQLKCYYRNHVERLEGLFCFIDFWT